MRLGFIRVGLLLASLLIASDGYTERLKLSAGRDTYAFDFNWYGRTIEVFVPRQGEPWSEDYENVAHDYMSLDGILEVEPRIRGKFVIGRTKNIGNAFAVIHKGERLMVYDPVLLGSWAGPRWLAVMAHELGHHICNHVPGLMKDNPLEKELEADQFSGYVIRLLMERSKVPAHTFKEVLAVVAEINDAYGSATHPPRDMRLAAIRKGYDNGSPCLKGAFDNFGIEIADLTEQLRRQYQIAHYRDGLIIKSVVPTMSASVRGLLPGDVIVELFDLPLSPNGGRAVHFPVAIEIVKESGRQSVSITVVRRDGSSQSIELPID